jgi:hypothetical protein
VRRCLLSIVLGVALAACAGGRPPDPLLEERAPTAAEAACLERPASAAYLEAVKQRIFDAWELPGGLRSDQELELLLALGATGDLYLAIVPDAGRSDLEESALAALEAAKPYPPLPPEADCLRGSKFRATFRNPVQRSGSR